VSLKVRDDEQAITIPSSLVMVVSTGNKGEQNGLDWSNKVNKVADWHFPGEYGKCYDAVEGTTNRGNNGPKV
jgi:hypothetical protein